MIPPSNHLEKLKGSLEGYYSIRINIQWRIIFIWDLDAASKVQIIDYHK
jgi:proteic killer suppression protein